MKKGNRLTKVLFDIRVNNLFKTSTNDENYYFLSGLIIGDELLGIKKGKNRFYYHLWSRTNI